MESVQEPTQQPSMEAIIQAVNKLTQDNEHLRKTNKTLKGSIIELQHLALQTQQISTNTSYLEPKASLPDKFDGSRYQFRGFLNQILLVFRLQSKRYSTDEDKINFVGTLLKGPALAWFAPLFETSFNIVSDWHAF